MMHGGNEDCAALSLVITRSLPAKRKLKDLAALSTERLTLHDAANHDPYRPVVRLMRLMCNLSKEGLTASVPGVPGCSRVRSRLLALL